MASGSLTGDECGGVVVVNGGCGGRGRSGGEVVVLMLSEYDGGG